MSSTILITANWHTGALSQQTISRQYDNNRYVIQFVGYPEADAGETLSYYLLVWMSTSPGVSPDEITPIELNSDQWYISNYFTQQAQRIKFQLCVLNSAGTFEAHSPIYTGHISGSLEHDGTTADIDVSTLFDAYREYLDSLIIAAGAVVIDNTLTQSGQAADAKKTGDEIATVKEDFDNRFDEISSTNRFNGTLTTGFMKLDGTTNSSSDYAYTDKIPVSATTFIVTADSITNGKRLNVPLRFITAFDENEDVLSAYGQQSVGSDNSYIETDGANVITLDSSVKYIVLSIYKPSEKFEDICVSFDTTFTDYVAYGTSYKLKGTYLPDIIEHVLSGKLNGKTVAVFGDSIMYGAGSDAVGPADLLATKYGMTVAKYCVSGATMGVRTDDPSYTVNEHHHIAKQVRDAIADEITPAVILLNGGTNDIGGSITIGEMTEVYTQPASESYFADGFETVAYLLRSNFVGVPIIYMRAHNMSSRSYTGQINYGELGNRIAEKWGILTADMYKRMNTQLADDRTAYLADYTHPNSAGYNKFYIPAIEETLFNIPVE